MYEAGGLDRHAESGQLGKGVLFGETGFCEEVGDGNVLLEGSLNQYMGFSTNRAGLRWS